MDKLNDLNMGTIVMLSWIILVAVDEITGGIGFNGNLIPLYQKTCDILQK